MDNLAAVGSLSIVNQINPDGTTVIDGNVRDKTKRNGDTPFTQTPVYKAILPMLWSLQIWGQGFFMDQGRCSPRSVIGRVYSSLVLVILWLNVGRMALIFAEGEVSGFLLFGKIIVFAWMFLCALNGLVMYRLSHTRLSIDKFFFRLQHLMSKGNSTCLHLVHSRTLVTTLLSWIFHLINISFIGYLVFYTHMLDIALIPATPDYKHIKAVRILVMALYAYLSAAWVFPTAFLFTLCLALYINISKFNSAFKEDKHRLLQMERYRTWHGHLIELVDLTDDMFSMQVACTLLVKILLETLTLYNMIWYPGLSSDPLVVLTNAFWLTSGFAVLTTVAVGGAIINHVVSNI